jgi:flagellar biosynthesis/type III secretory pathway protein FliH
MRSSFQAAEGVPVTLLSRLIRRAEIGKDPYPVSAEREEDLMAAADDNMSDAADSAEDERNRVFEEGRAQGFAACKAEMEAEVREKVERFTSMVDDLMVQKKRLLMDSEEAVMKLSCDIARRIVAKMAEIDEAMILDIVRNALGHLADRQKVAIRVNPADAEVLKAHGDEITQASGAGSTVEIVEDVRIKRGGCLIEGESGSVEAQLDRQVDMIEKALMEAVHAG